MKYLRSKLELLLHQTCVAQSKTTGYLNKVLLISIQKLKVSTLQHPSALCKVHQRCV